MNRFRNYIDRFFQIRAQVPLGENVLLGVLPLLAILLIWTFLTWGKRVTVVLPDGFLEDPKGDPIPAAGRFIEDRTRMRLKDATIVSQITDDTTNDTTTVLFWQGENFTTTLPVEQIEGKVAIILKEGYFIKRETSGQEAELPSASATGMVPGDVSQNTISISRGGVPTPVTRAGAVAAPPPKPITKLTFRYELMHTRRKPSTILPSPREVIRALPDLLKSEEPNSSRRSLPSNLWISLKRVVFGFLVALLICFPIGILMGSFSRGKSVFAPLMVFSGYTPIPALVPLFMAFFGLSETQKIMFLAMAFTIYLLPLFVRAIEEIDNVYLQTAYTLGATRWQAMRHVLVAIALPNIYDAMRMGFGVGWSYILLVEMVDMGSGGVGASMLVSQRRGFLGPMYLTLLAIVSLAFLTDKVWELVGNALFPYRRLKR